MVKNHSMQSVKERMFELLKHGSRSEGLLGRELKIDHETVKKTIEELRADGYEINEDRGNYYLLLNPRSEFIVTSAQEYSAQTVATAKMLFSSDWQLGAREAQIHLARRIGPLAKKEKVDFIILPGDLLNGVRIFPGQDRGENRLNNIDEQEDLLVELLKDLDIPVAIRDGNHEAKTFTTVGHNPIWNVYRALTYEKGKKNFVFIEPRQPYYENKGIIVELSHPYKGQTLKKTYGPVYALTKRLGSFVMVTRMKLAMLRSESWKEGEQSDKPSQFAFKPHVRAIGNMHTSVSAIHAGVAFYLIPCLQKQTGFERAKELWHQVGVWIATISVNSLGRVCGITNKYISWDGELREHNEGEILMQSKINEACLLRRPD